MSKQAKGTALHYARKAHWSHLRPVLTLCGIKVEPNRILDPVLDSEQRCCQHCVDSYRKSTMRSVVSASGRYTLAQIKNADPPKGG